MRTRSKVQEDTGHRKALLIALTYAHAFPERESVTTLEKPHKDLERLTDHLVAHWKYERHNITKMRDDSSDPNMLPTRDNILREIASLVKGVQPGDRRVFYFSGHCYQIVNRRGTEHDNLDEVILTHGPYVPPDPETNQDGTLKYFDPAAALAFDDPRKDTMQGIIIDNELRQLLVDKIPFGAKLVAISDTCHSGTLFDLDYHWHGVGSQMKTLSCGRGKRRKLGKSLSKKAHTVVRREAVYYSRDATIVPGQSDSQHRSGSKPMFVDPECAGPNDDGVWFDDRERCMSPEPSEPPDVASVSSSQDNQLTWSGKETMTSHLINIIERLSHTSITYQELTKQLNEKMGKSRCKMVSALWVKEGKKGDYKKRGLKKVKEAQIPVIGSLDRNGPRNIFKL